MVIIIGNKYQELLSRVAASNTPFHLYESLNYVGDDTVKTEIDGVLEQVLSPETYDLVVAVFRVATCTGITQAEISRILRSKRSSPKRSGSKTPNRPKRTRKSAGSKRTPKRR